MANSIPTGLVLGMVGPRDVVLQAAVGEELDDVMGWDGGIVGWYLGWQSCRCSVVWSSQS